MDGLEARDGRDDKPIFIHSELDDYGLSAIEFRVYARLARRAGQAGAYESVPSMAREFEVSDRTIQRCLKLLTLCRLITEQIRPGKSTRYHLNPRSVWAPKSQLKAIRASSANKAATPRPDVTGDTTAGGGVTPQRGVVVTPRRGEGTPLEGTPQKGVATRVPRSPNTAHEPDGGSVRKTRPVAPPATPEECIARARDNPAYARLDVARIFWKMSEWCAAHNKRPTYKRFVNWLNNEDVPLDPAPRRPAADPDEQKRLKEMYYARPTA